MDFIPSITSDEVLKLLSSCSDKSSPMDFVHTSLLKSWSAFSELITISLLIITLQWIVKSVKICLSAFYHLTTHTASHYQQNSQNHRLLIRYLPSLLRQLSAVWNFNEKYSSPSANAERPRTSCSLFFGVSSATLPIFCVICTGYLFSTLFSLN